MTSWTKSGGREAHLLFMECDLQLRYGPRKVEKEQKEQRLAVEIGNVCGFGASLPLIIASSRLSIVMYVQLVSKYC